MQVTGCLWLRINRFWASNFSILTCTSVMISSFYAIAMCKFAFARAKAVLKGSALILIKTIYFSLLEMSVRSLIGTSFSGGRMHLNSRCLSSEYGISASKIIFLKVLK